MEPEQRSRTELELPDETGVCVCFPGVVRDEQRALAMLGGADAVSEALRLEDRPLECRMRAGVRRSRRPRPCSRPDRHACPSDGPPPLLSRPDPARAKTRRTQDAYAHAMISSENPVARKLLLRLRPSADGGFEAIVVARLPTSHDFRSLADCQVLLRSPPAASAPPFHCLSRRWRRWRFRAWTALARACLARTARTPRSRSSQKSL